MYNTNILIPKTFNCWCFVPTQLFWRFSAKQINRIRKIKMVDLNFSTERTIKSRELPDDSNPPRFRERAGVVVGKKQVEGGAGWNYPVLGGPRLLDLSGFNQFSPQPLHQLDSRGCCTHYPRTQCTQLWHSFQAA